MYSVYKHIRPDTNQVFYVGRGTKQRSNSKGKRNIFWQNIVKKNNGNFTIEIIKEDLSLEESNKLEIELIKFYGRKDLGLGTLVNLTDGGDGINNLTLEARQRISQGRKNYIVTDEYRKNLSLACSGEKNGMFGKKHSQEAKKKVSIGKKGKSIHNSESRLKMSQLRRGIPKKRINCPHCNKNIAINMSKRWHFDNCKLIKI